MPVRRRKRHVEVQYRPPMPAKLRNYFPGDWGAPSWEGAGSDWEAAHQAAYRRWQQAVGEWRTEHKHMPVDPASAPQGDELWCGEFDEHDCGGAECLPRRDGA